MGIYEENPCCNSKETNIRKGISLSLKGKMKVLKKIKRRMGLVSRSNSGGGGTNNLPPLLFHNVHGENIRISRDGTVARRAESFCKGIAFSSRPVKVNEKICIKLLEISNNWSGVIRFGYTYNDPSGLRYGLPKYACPDLTNKPGYWAKALPERFCSQNAVLFYYVTSAGDVHFGINGEEKGIFFTGVETRGPLWALLDVYGNSIAVEFVDFRHQLNNSRRSMYFDCDTNNDEVERMTERVQQVHIQHRDSEEMNLPPLKYQSSRLSFAPVPLHRTKGKNVKYNSSRGIAARTDTEFCQGYVFTARPIQLGERIVVQVLAIEPMFQGCLGLGLTACDPNTLQSSDLPDDSNFLLDRPEYWVVSRDFARNLNRGDEISFYVSPNGQVQISRNGAPPSVVIHVDQTLRLWAFFDIYGSTQRIRILSSSGPASPSRNSDSRVTTPINSESMNSINSQSEVRRTSVQSNPRLVGVVQTDVQVQPTANLSPVLSVLLSPVITHPAGGIPVTSGHSQHSSQTSVHNPNGNTCTSNQIITFGGNQNVIASTRAVVPASHPVPAIAGVMALPPSLPPVTSGTIISSCSNMYIEPVSNSSDDRAPTGWIENGALVNAGSDCTICYENPIDAVLYMCGHMCMCYECALQQWRGKGGGQCPLCRAVIRDVIRTYKS